MSSENEDTNGIREDVHPIIIPNKIIAKLLGYWPDGHWGPYLWSYDYLLKVDGSLAYRVLEKKC